MIRCSDLALVFVAWCLAMSAGGCATSGSGGASVRPTSRPLEQICFSRKEVARIMAFKVRCRAKIAEVRARSSHELKTQRHKHQTAQAQCQFRLKACFAQAKLKNDCPSCAASAVWVGVVAGGVGVVLGVAAGVVATLVMQGGKP